MIAKHLRSFTRPLQADRIELLSWLAKQPGVRGAGPMYVQKQGSYGQQGYPAPGPGFAQPQAAFSQGQQFPNTPSQPPWQGGQAQGFY